MVPRRPAQRRPPRTPPGRPPPPPTSSTRSNPTSSSSRRSATSRPSSTSTPTSTPPASPTSPAPGSTTKNIPEKLNPDNIQQQCGLLSRLPWTETWEADFATLPNPKPARGWIAATYQISGTNITVYNGHLKSNFGAKSPDDDARNREQRRLAIIELQNDLQRRGLDPLRDRIIVGGDFNTDYFNPDFASETVFQELDSLGFRNTLSLLAKDQRITLPAREGEPWPDSTFDYLFVSAAWGTVPDAIILPEGAAKRKDVFGGDEPGLASDHYPVFIDLPLP
ncbi:MAG: hypothetical protein HC901_04000 [Bdellovibrionaceae bacterium]|nr:hypothetical protein [Pseudobdellovibrionaceae bacterium]